MTLTTLEQEMPMTTEIVEMIDFIRRSTRGVALGARRIYEAGD